MIYTIYDIATGQILKNVVTHPSRLHLQYDPVTQDYLEEPVDDTAFYIEDGEPVPMPAQPDTNHEFDWNTKTWFDARKVVDVKENLRLAIDRERNRRIYAPITYDGALLDADSKAQSNISNKLLEIQSREALGQTMPAELMVWRDHTNQNHEFNDTQEYKDWLNGLTIAISLRGTQAYVWAWGKKAELETLTTLSGLDNFDPVAD